jgi:hypothetical protein
MSFTARLDDRTDATTRQRSGVRWQRLAVLGSSAATSLLTLGWLIRLCL